MNTKQLLLEELEQTPEPLLVEVLDFLRFLKHQREQDDIDLIEARSALEDAKQNGTVPWETIKAELGLES